MAPEFSKEAIDGRDDENRKVCKRWFVVGREEKEVFQSFTKIKV
jgi:hypothetical protein